MQKRILFILSLFGLITAMYLVYVYFNTNFLLNTHASICSINSFIDCDSVAKTPFSQFLGIPLALLGTIFYLLIMFLLFVDKLKYRIPLFNVFKNPLSYIFTFSSLSFILSIILAFISLSIIKKVCIFCFLMYFINLLIAIASKNYKENLFYEYKDTVKDFISGLKTYPKTSIILILLTSLLLLFTYKTNILSPQVKYLKTFKEFERLEHNPYPVKGNILGDENAKIVIYEYSDYKCPFCKIHSLILHKLAKELKGIKIVHINLPFDKSCNRLLKDDFHIGACTLSQYAIAAKKQNHFWDFHSLLFDKQPSNEAQILDIAKQLNLNITKLKNDAFSTDTQKELLKEIDYAYSNGVYETPTLIINDVSYKGLIPYEQLKKLLLSLGASHRE